jgi:hypothetical protein
VKRAASRLLASLAAITPSKDSGGAAVHPEPPTP